MGTQERRGREKRHRIATILDAAETVFRERGIDVSTVADVAGHAELAKGTIYLYFGSKASLVNAVTLQGIRLLCMELSSSTEGAANGLEKLMRIGAAYFQFHALHPFYANLLVQYHTMDTQGKEDPWLAECLMAARDSLGVIANAITEGQKDGSIRKGIDPVVHSLLCWSFAAGTIQMIQNKSDLLEMAFETNADQMRRSFFEFIEQTLATHQ